MRSAAAISMLVLGASAMACTGGHDVGEPAAPSGGVYLAVAHSHNDYERGRPLLDALERGFASVEVDVHLVDGVLLVGHDPEEVRPSRNLSNMYLDPLREVVDRTGGWIYGPDAPALQLLIDVKTDAQATYRALDDALASYGDLFTRWTQEGTTHGPVVAVLSGNRAVSTIAADSVRYVAIDGRLTDPDRDRFPPEVMPLVSIDWEEVGTSDPAGRLEAARRIVEAVHTEGRRVRFWGTPDEEELWRTLRSLGVDYIGTDDPELLHRVLREPAAGASVHVEDGR